MTKSDKLMKKITKSDKLVKKTFKIGIKSDKLVRKKSHKIE